MRRGLDVSGYLTDLVIFIIVMPSINSNFPEIPQMLYFYHISFSLADNLYMLYT